MDINDEFATVDAVLASGAETRGVDAFALALIKAERQMRKLFTYLVFQADAFTSDNVPTLKSSLAGRRVYFRDFVVAWNKLCSCPLREIVGPDYDRLGTVLERANGYRNKIFHGQLTAEGLSRDDLIALTTDIRSWCRALADGAQRELGYDGFGRNSFRKADRSLQRLLAARIRNVADYDQLLANMDKSSRKRSPAVGAAAIAGKRGRLNELLVAKFPFWLSYFESQGPFRSYGQLEYHRETIDRRKKLGSAAEAMRDEMFQRCLYKTLRAWGIGVRRSRLKPFTEFASILSQQRHAIGQFENLTIDDPQLDVPATGEALWALMSELPIVENTAWLVPVTKTLHHMLPELVVPMDREYTQIFFGWQNPQFQYRQRNCFVEAFGAFAQIARIVDPLKYVGPGWNSSRTKVIDNAIVGLVQCAKGGGTVEFP